MWDELVVHAAGQGSQEGASRQALLRVMEDCMQRGVPLLLTELDAVALPMEVLRLVKWQRRCESSLVRICGVRGCVYV